MRSAVLMWCLVTSVQASAADVADTIIHQVMAASEARMDAFNRRDADALASLMADDCLLSDDAGSLKTGADLVRAVRSFRSPWDDRFGLPENVVGRAIGDVVILQFRYEEYERFGDHDVVSVMSALETWRRDSGHWRLAAKSVTPVPVNYRKAMEISPERLRDYVGVYEWRPGLDEEVTIDAGHLVSRYAGGPPTPLRFVAPDVQVTDDDLGTSYVKRDPDGRVTGYRFERADGQSIEVRRIR